ncbi:endonuclease/exonuclease/phosphatase family protein [Promethearchaeum syntrophicum]|uniref:Endonuclease/exonuclease/phosphatase family protein n=1 Tax=Promethearchaeum syntrophicum TaxID=2594042 RepID=A0A5B9D9B7_9ARCH|nr:endonuclease/exonuclease/phosphatase family protein [Candidatus Prometheoarchaeum syntrophicum]QEE15734.1 Endonuclease/Exonuclease/phosphatase family protein [Candidatus Prometheoarchaeum syntrophicum]
MEKINNFFKYKHSELILVSIMFLFFLELFSDFVESVYIFALMTLSLNVNVLSVLFFFTPVLLLFFRKKVPDKVLLIVGLLMVISRILEPLFDTTLRMLISGLGVGCFMFYFPAFLSRQKVNNEETTSYTLGIGLIVALSISILFRTLNSSIDISTYTEFQIVGWILGGLEINLFIRHYNNCTNEKESSEKLESPSLDSNSENHHKKKGRIFVYIIGIFSILLVINFVFNGSTVLARWTEGNYIFITSSIIIILCLFAILLLYKPELIFNLKPYIIYLWNGLFFIFLVVTIAVNQISFPHTLDIYPIVVSQPKPLQLLPLALLIILIPILFIDFILLIRLLIKCKPTVKKLAWSFTFGGGFYSLLMIFAIIFTSTWGFVPPVSFFFRDRLWLVFLFITGCFTNFNWFRIVKKNPFIFKDLKFGKKTKKSALILLGIIGVGTIAGVIALEPRPIAQPAGATSFKILTYNLQQGTNDNATKNYDGQLEQIREIDADVIGLQESSKIAGNSDVVRYFADKLNMYSYFGPKGVTGTTGVALLSKYPIQCAKTLYHYNEDSDRKQTATIEAEIVIGSRTFTIYITHTYGSMDAKSMLVNDILDRSVDKENVLFIGDMNFRQYSEPYNITTNVLVDAWLDIWPKAVDDNGLNASRRIDHIFVDPDLNIDSCEYIDWIEIESDHPAGTAVVSW